MAVYVSPFSLCQRDIEDMIKVPVIDMMDVYKSLREWFDAETNPMRQWVGGGWATIIQDALGIYDVFHTIPHTPDRPCPQ